MDDVRPQLAAEPARFIDQLRSTVRDGKGGSERLTLLARSLIDELKQQIVRAEKLHAYDTARLYNVRSRKQFEQADYAAERVSTEIR